MQFQHKPILSKKEINKFKTSQGGKKYLAQSKKPLQPKVPIAKQSKLTLNQLIETI